MKRFVYAALLPSTVKDPDQVTVERVSGLVFEPREVRVDGLLNIKVNQSFLLMDRSGGYRLICGRTAIGGVFLAHKGWLWSDEEIHDLLWYGKYPATSRIPRSFSNVREWVRSVAELFN